MYQYRGKNLMKKEGDTTLRLSSQIDRIEQTVNDLSSKLDVVIEQGSDNASHLKDLKSEMEHYGTLLTNVTKHLKQNQHRLAHLFWALGFFCVGIMFWIISRI